MCRKYNVSLVELINLYKLKLRREMNEAYCSARDYTPSVVASLDEQNKGQREECWTPEWRLYRKTIYRSAKDNVLKFEKIAFPGVVFDRRGGKRTKKNKNTAEVHYNKPKDNKRGSRISNINLQLKKIVLYKFLLVKFHSITCPWILLLRHVWVQH